MTALNEQVINDIVKNLLDYDVYDFFKCAGSTAWTTNSLILPAYVTETPVIQYSVYGRVILLAQEKARKYYGNNNLIMESHIVRAAFREFLKRTGFERYQDYVDFHDSHTYDENMAVLDTAFGAK